MGRRIVITEAQFNALMEQQMLTESFSSILEKVAAGTLAVYAAIFMVKNCSGLSQEQKVDMIQQIEQASPSNSNNTENTISYNSVEDKIFREKVEACEKCMELYLGRHNLTLDSTQLTPFEIVRICEENSFDIAFVLSAAWNETHFGTSSPRAQSVNTAFSQGCYDNGKNACKFDNMNQSVEGYINLLNNDYLVDGKTIYDLMKPGQFVNKIGKRYASAKGYEDAIRKTRNSIIKLFPILKG